MAPTISRHGGVPSAQATAVTVLALGQLAYPSNCRFLARSSVAFDALRGYGALWWSALALVALLALTIFVAVWAIKALSRRNEPPLPQRAA